MKKAARSPKTRVQKLAARTKPRPRIKKSLMVAVIDGARANIYKAEASATGRPGLRLTVIDGGRLRQSNRKSRAIVSDRPGHKASSAGTGRYALQPKSDPHVRAEQQFVIGVAEFLDRALAAQGCDELVLVAPPRAMGDLRAHLSPAVARRTILEITQEWTALTPSVIGQRVAVALMPET
ncbi:MAG: host attachment protein [Rhodospirillaceae bacterium]|nr:host attachment protein [Rhodospirillaceae bacterium]